MSYEVATSTVPSRKQVSHDLHEQVPHLLQRAHHWRQTHEATEGPARMRTRPEHALFEPAFCLPGILRCQVKGCGELFIAAAHVQALKSELAAEGRPTKWLGAPDAENARRRQHAETHLQHGEATLDRFNGFFLLATHLRPKPRALTAADHGF